MARLALGRRRIIFLLVLVVLVGHFFTFVGDLDLRTETLVVGIFHDLANAHVTGRKMERVVSFGIGWEPVFVVDLFPPGGEFGEQIFVVFLFTNVRNGLAVSFNDLKVMIVHPDTALKISLLPDNFFGGYIEHVAVQLIFLLLAYVQNVVFTYLVRSQHKR